VIATRSESSAHHRSYPVYPVVLRKRQSGHARPQTACRIKRGSRVIDIGKADDEQHKTDADWRDKSVFRFLRSQHEDRESEIGCQELDVYLSAQRAVGCDDISSSTHHLKKNSLRHRRVRRELRLHHIDIDGGNTAHNSSSANRAEALRWKQYQTT
jgi:hypothetical protein